MQYLTIITLILALSSVSPKMVYMAELFRHGARYPTHDIYDGKDTKAFRGQLIGTGMRQQYLLGSYLRKDYHQSLGLSSQFNGRQVEVISDATQRCVESAYAHMAGWFPLGSGPEVPQGLDPSFLAPPFEQNNQNNQNNQNQNILNQPAEADGHQSVPIKINKYYFIDCKKEAQIFEKRAQVIAAEVLLFEAEQQSFMLKMKGIFNLTLAETNLGSMTQLYDTVDCDYNLGRPMPQNFTEQEFRQLKYIQNYLFALVYGGHPARVFSTPVAKTVLDNMDRVISGKESRKLTVFSGHDSTIAPLLTFLNLTSAECVRKKFKNETIHGNCGDPVPFASSLQFQLHQKDSLGEIDFDTTDPSSYFVKIRYNGDYYEICGSTAKECSYPTFSTRVRSHLADYDKECGIQ